MLFRSRRSGRLVRVGGLVVDLTEDGFHLDDGTAVGRVVLSGDALDRLSLIEPDDALNAIGRVVSTENEAVVVVDAPGGLIMAGDPVPAVSPDQQGPVADPSATAGPTASDGLGTRLAGLAGPPWKGDPGIAGVGTLFLISALSLAVTLARRERARRRLANRIAARLGALSRVPAGATVAAPAERGPSTTHSA